MSGVRFRVSEGREGLIFFLASKMELQPGRIRGRNRNRIFHNQKSKSIPIPTPMISPEERFRIARSRQ